jgi:hypothetical protein
MTPCGRHDGRPADVQHRRLELAGRGHDPARPRTLRVVEVRDGEPDALAVLVVEDMSR